MHKKGAVVAALVKRLEKVNGHKGCTRWWWCLTCCMWQMCGVVDGKEDKAREAKRFVEKMGRVQRMGVLQVIRALKIMPNDLLDAHVGLEPISVRIRRVCVTAVARIVTLPKTHLLQKPAERSVVFMRHHHALLHHLMRALGEYSKNIETIDGVCHLPDWKCPVGVILGEMEDEATKRERNIDTDIRIYTNELGY